MPRSGLSLVEERCARSASRAAARPRCARCWAHCSMARRCRARCRPPAPSACPARLRQGQRTHRRPRRQPAALRRQRRAAAHAAQPPGVGLRHPALLVGVTFLVVLFLLVYVVPRFALVLDNAVQDIAPLSRLLIELARRARRAGPIWIGWRSRWAPAPGWCGARRAPASSPCCCSRPCGCRGCAPGRAQLRPVAAGAQRRDADPLRHPGAEGAGRAASSSRSATARALDRALAAAATGTPLAQSLHEAGLLDALTWRVLRVWRPLASCMPRSTAWPTCATRSSGAAWSASGG